MPIKQMKEERGLDNHGNRIAYTGTNVIVLVQITRPLKETHKHMCLFLEQWEDERSELRAYNSTQAAYKRWKEQTLAYYAANAVKCTEPEELDRDELIARRTELLEKEYGNNESNE